jgi:hypothetical protein
MANRIALSAATLASALFFSGIALAEQPRSTGPAMGSDVTPSTAIQKGTEGRSSSGATPSQAAPDVGAPAAAGVPGAEGQPGTQSGPAVK